MSIFRERRLGNWEYDEYDIMNILRERRLGNCEYDEYDIINIYIERDSWEAGNMMNMI